MPISYDVEQYLADLSGHYARPYVDALSDLIVARVQGTRAQVSDARWKFAKVMSETLGVAELIGAATVLKHAARNAENYGRTMSGWAPFNRSWHERDQVFEFSGVKLQTLLPNKTVGKAVEDFVRRTPVTFRDAADRTASKISALYESGRVVAFVKSAEEAVTERAQAFISDALKQGVSGGMAGAGLQMSVESVRNQTEAWTRAYAEMAFRTNVNTALTAGRFRQVLDPEIRQVIPAFRYDAVGDEDTRPSHMLADGVILAADNPAWAKLSPPLGYNCRCQVVMMSVWALKAEGHIDDNGDLIESVIPSEAGPDPGFRHGGRADIFLASEAM